MVADGRACSGDFITDENVVKMVRRPDGTIMGCSGEQVVAAIVLNWFNSGEDKEAIPEIKHCGGNEELAFSALILRPSGAVEYMEQNFHAVPQELPAATGSGGHLATVLMLAGKSPREAVEIVASRVVSVGGKIIEFKVGEQ